MKMGPESQSTMSAVHLEMLKQGTRGLNEHVWP